MLDQYDQDLRRIQSAIMVQRRLRQQKRNREEDLTEVNKAIQDLKEIARKHLIQRKLRR